MISLKAALPFTRPLTPNPSHGKPGVLNRGAEVAVLFIAPQSSERESGGGEEEVGEGGVVAWQDGKTKAKSVSGSRGRRRDVSRESMKGGDRAGMLVCTYAHNVPTQHNTTQLKVERAMIWECHRYCLVSTPTLPHHPGHAPFYLFFLFFSRLRSLSRSLLAISMTSQASLSGAGVYNEERADARDRFFLRPSLTASLSRSLALIG